jgi:aspartate racemase
MLHIADATCDEIVARGCHRTVGILGTDATLAARLFHERLEARGLRCIAPTAVDLEELVLPAIECVKRHALEKAYRLTRRACETLRDAGAEAIILGCTELPLAIQYESNAVAALCIDPTRALARACVRWWHSVQVRPAQALL